MFFTDKKKFDIQFLSSPSSDEIWTRSTAIACAKEGLKIEVLACGKLNKTIVEEYRRNGINVIHGRYIGLRRASKTKCKLCITSSTGLSRRIFMDNYKKVIHMPHSLASLHMIYPSGTFNPFDILFAAGPHHYKEYNSIISNQKLKNRLVFPIGYGKMDIFKQSKVNYIKEFDKSIKKILIAPSWGKDNFLDYIGYSLIKKLSNSNFHVIVRPHPIIIKENKDAFKKIKFLEKNAANIEIEYPEFGDKAIHYADILIGDYSGISLEYASLRKKPVLSINVPKKEINSKWKDLNINPIEIQIRQSIGQVVEPDLDKIFSSIEFLIEENKIINESILEKFIYSPDKKTSSNALKVILSLIT